MIDVARFYTLKIERNLGLGEPLTAVESTGSTNDDALAAPPEHGALFVAEEQTAGRGRRGSRWLSRKGENLLLSVILRRAIAPEAASALSLAVGLALRDALALRVNDPVLLKWPNDIVVHGKKLAGILMESRMDGKKLSALVAGVGLNVKMTEPDPEIAETATSLALLGATDLERESLLVDVLLELDRRVDEYAEHGLSRMLPELRRYDALDGRQVRVGEIEGTASGIGADGALVVRGFDGTLRQARSGTVEFL
jgi:BirA family biotin operon repressor/biotin-[acetyl-CoA-carboxylase] ligase